MVAARAAAKREIEAGARRATAALSSIADEIERLRVEEARRQEELAPAGGCATGEPGRGDQHAIDTSVIGAAVETPEAAIAPPSRYGGVVGIAMQYLGIPYLWGGASPASGFDCSGFAMYVYAQVGVSLPHHAASQYSYGVPSRAISSRPATSSSSTGSGTWASTSAAASSSTRRTRATS